MPSSRSAAFSSVALLGAVAQVAGQCLSLAASTTCPGFSTQYINPQNLAAAWPFFSNVNSVAQFDVAFQQYLISDNGFRTTKYNNQLGCANTTTPYTLQYAQTFLCSEFTQISYTAGCYAESDVTRKMMCQQTCLQFAASENDLIADSTACNARASFSSQRQATLTTDFTSCTDWTTLQSNNTETCVLGQNNERNCGFGSSNVQLCAFCDASGGQVDSCCGSSLTDLSSCGYNLAASQISASPGASSSSSATGTAASEGAGASSGSSGSSLSAGAKAGIAVGVIVGALLLLGLLFLAVRNSRKNRQSAHQPMQGNSKGSPDLAEKGGFFGASKSKQTGSPQSGSTDGMDSPPRMAKTGSADSGQAEANMLLGGAAGAAAARHHAKEQGPRPFSDLSASSADSNEGRNLVSSYRDQYSSIDITPGSEVIAIYSYNPNLPDELALSPETVVRVRKMFDDGWAVGSIVGGSGSGKSEGAFPLVVCTAVGSEAADNFTTSSASAYSREGGPAPVTSRPPSMRNGRTSSRSDRERSDRDSYMSAATQPRL